MPMNHSGLLFRATLYTYRHRKTKRQIYCVRRKYYSLTTTVAETLAC